MSPVVMIALPVPSEAPGDELTDVNRVPRGTTVFGQSVAEGLDAFRQATNEQATYDTDTLVGAIFGALQDLDLSDDGDGGATTAVEEPAGWADCRGGIARGTPGGFCHTVFFGVTFGGAVGAADEGAS